jgi:hypothetical protein
MAIFPKVQNPCPFVNRLSELMDGDVCRACRRQVFDLSAMTGDERAAFMLGCKGSVCVSYRMRVRPVLAAAVMAAAVAAPTAAAACEPEIVIVGGISDPANVEYVEDASDSATPVLPVVYEEGSQQ